MPGEIRDVFGSESLPNDVENQIGGIASKIENVIGEMEKAREDDTARWQALNEERKVLAGELTDLKNAKDKADIQAEDAKVREETKALLASLRSASKAREIGTMRSPRGDGEYQKGSFLSALDTLGSNSFSDEAKSAAKAALSVMSQYADVPAYSKSTLGLTDATGGWVIPNAIVDTLVKPARYQSAITRLVTTVEGMGNQYQIDIPMRLAAPDRAVIAAWGSLKENKDLVYNGYTATMYTLARIYDISKQFLRKSAGAAEADVMGELAHAFALGEAYYIMQGSGSSEPYGLQTALATIPAMTAAHTAAATLTGSASAAITKAAGALADRNRTPEAALVAPAAYWTLVAAGSDTGGFYLDPTSTNPGGQLRVFGIPVYPEAQILGADDLIVGEFSALKVYHGESYRVDSSDVANTRWDYNLVGFRGEMEMGLDARPSVYAGAFAFIADIIV
jgi:HK97 family phage major capsid protein